MSDIIPTGAYVIRNKKASTVLHVEDPDVTKTWSNVVAYEQDENRYHGQQIWWIEPLPGHKDSKDELVYSITNPSSGRSLDMNAGSGRTSRRRGDEGTRGRSRGVCLGTLTECLRASYK